ncbi:hypothetical protein SAMN05192534_11713 [Alteribacillus persepolensis]|uniref:Uncharacterized protein n=1 Tax=Alteribacillus persepolensis TaxID=568899 RepID=A0A1G8GUE3_9BACI|nr:hypothetical protein [Alteribacillus persepolensis]SDH97890.1 hypothetical protein SAMN05192534_11713 [Alteribacillus persepolensis]
MTPTTMMKWITGSLELFLGIPILGGSIIIGLSWSPLFVMLILHIITLILASRSVANRHGSILGIVTSCLAWIPFVGWAMHVVTGIILMIDAAKNK